MAAEIVEKKEAKVAVSMTQNLAKGFGEVPITG